MFKIHIICCLLALTTATVVADEAAQSTDGRIVEGQAIDINKAPHTVQLKHINGGRQFCGGTLIASDIVLSAAHCFDKIKPEGTRVVAGATSTREWDNGQKRLIQRVQIPPEYTPATMHKDVAIIKLESPFDLNNNVQTVKLCQQRLPVNSNLLVTGWGSKYKGGEGTTTLRAIQIPTISEDQCKLKYKNFPTEITDLMICAHGGKQDACQGDSGGPAVYDGQLCGIVSWGIGCGNGLPGVYSDVYNMRDYIEEVISTM